MIDKNYIMRHRTAILTPTKNTHQFLFLGSQLIVKKLTNDFFIKIIQLTTITFNCRNTEK